jgi:hypothetical protein
VQSPGSKNGYECLIEGFRSVEEWYLKFLLGLRTFVAVKLSDDGTLVSQHLGDGI